MNLGYKNRPRGERIEVGSSALCIRSSIQRLEILHPDESGFRMTRIRGGFTLIELLVVIGVIAILLSILAPVVNKVRYQARKAQCANNMRQVCMSFRLYGDEDKSWRLPPTVADTQYRNSKLPPDIYVCYPEKPKRHHRSLFTPHKPYIDGPEPFYCTSMPSKPSYRFAAFEAGDAWDNPQTREKGDAMTGPYCIFPNYEGILETTYGYRKFEGIKKIDGGRGQSKVVILDTLNHGNWRCPDGVMSPEPIKKAGILGRTPNTMDMWYYLCGIDDVNEIRGWMQVGYIGGNVESISIGDTEMLSIGVIGDQLGRFGKYKIPSHSVYSR